MEYKYSIGDRIVGIENTPLEETEEEEYIVGKKRNNNWTYEWRRRTYICCYF